MRCISIFIALALAMPASAVGAVAEPTGTNGPSKREIAKRKDELAKLERRYRREVRECQDGNYRSCSTAQNTYAQIQLILPTIPAEPRSPKS